MKLILLRPATDWKITEVTAETVTGGEALATKREAAKCIQRKLAIRKETLSIHKTKLRT